MCHFIFFHIFPDFSGLPSGLKKILLFKNKFIFQIIIRFLILKKKKKFNQINISGPKYEKKKLKNKGKLISRQFKHWSLSSSFHCFPKIFQNSHFAVRSIWTILFLIFSFLTFKLLFRSFVEYLKYDVVSKIRVINEKSSPFPTVTICDANPFSTNEAQKMLQPSKIQTDFFSLQNFTNIEISLIQMEYNKNTIMQKSVGLSYQLKKKTWLFVR